MTVYVDQSGKIEDTNKVTVVAFSNGKWGTVKLGAREKQVLLPLMRELDYPGKTFVFKTFAALVFLALQHHDVDDVVIDKEYPGHEPYLKALILELFRRANLKRPDISFATIGRANNAHKLALETFRGKRKPDRLVKARDVVKLWYGGGR